MPATYNLHRDPQRGQWLTDGQASIWLHKDDSAGDWALHTCEQSGRAFVSRGRGNEYQCQWADDLMEPARRQAGAPLVILMYVAVAARASCF